jgi:ZIP family zinc transporter
MTSLAYIGAAAAAGAAGGAIASFWAPDRWVTSYIQHFTAGVVVAAVALEVAPEIVRMAAPPLLVLAGFALGGLAMIALKWATLRIEKAERQRRALPWGLVMAAAVDTLLDGAIIGTGFALGHGLGLVLSFALGLELLFLTMSVASSFREKGGSHAATLAVSSGIALLLLAGGLGGDLLARGASQHTLAVLLSFGAAALLYLVTEELLVETHLPEETLLSTAMFFLGFLIVFAFVAFAPLR